MEQLQISVINETSQGLKSSAIIVNGSLISSNSKKLKTHLVKMLKENDHLRVVIQQTEEIDLSVLQLCYALDKSATAAKKRVTFEANLSEELSMTLEKAGFTIMNG